MFKPGLRATMVIGAVVVALLVVGLPYMSYTQLSTSHVEADEFPYNLGFRLKVSYEVHYDAVERTQSYIELTVTTTEYNAYSQVDYDPKPDYWSYVVHYWGIGAASVAPDTDEAAFAVSLTVLFTPDSESIQPYYVKLDGLHEVTWTGYDEPGTYTESWEVDRRGYSGTYTVRAVLLVAPGDYWNASLDSDTEVVVYENPFE